MHTNNSITRCQMLFFECKITKRKPIDVHVTAAHMYIHVTDQVGQAHRFRDTHPLLLPRL